MKLRIKVSPKSGERDQSFTHTYGDVKYTVGPEPVEVSDEVGRYLSSSFSDLIEVIPEPVVEPISEPIVLKPVAIPVVKPKKIAKKIIPKKSPKK